MSCQVHNIMPCASCLETLSVLCFYLQNMLLSSRHPPENSLCIILHSVNPTFCTDAEKQASKETSLQGPLVASSPQNVSLYISIDVPLSKAIIEERRRNTHLQIQAVCLAVTDSNVCQNRLHWPDRMEVSVRSQAARVMSRNHKLGANGRDAPTDLTPWLTRDATSVQVSVKALGPENSFLFGVRAVVPQPTEVMHHIAVL